LGTLERFQILHQFRPLFGQEDLLLAPVIWVIPTLKESYCHASVYHTRNGRRTCCARTSNLCGDDTGITAYQRETDQVDQGNLWQVYFCVRLKRQEFIYRLV